jgi:SEC-C motif-containing protein
MWGHYHVGMTPRIATATLPCPCGSGVAYERCCARYHAGPEQLRAPSPEALMRSLYSAYALGLADYLLATWHPSTRPARLEAADPALKWLGLEVRARGSTDADHGTIEFVARSKRAGRAHRLHETSRFVREDGRWFYVDGDLK